MKNTKPSLTLAITGLIAGILFSNISFAENAKPNNTYQEMEFIQTFKGKNKAFVLQTLGQPTKNNNDPLNDSMTEFIRF